MPPPLRCAAFKHLRESRDLKQADLARLAGVSLRTIERYERAEEAPRDEEARLLHLMDYGPDAVDEIVQATLRGERPVAAPASPVDPTTHDLRLVRRLAGEASRNALDATEAHLLRFVSHWRACRARAKATDLVNTLLSLSPERRRLRVESMRQFQTWAVAERLAEQSEKAAPNKADMALELAELACLAADQAEVTELFRPRLQGYCRAFVANAQRVGGKLQRADETFEQAWALWEAGAPGDPGRLLAEWRLLDRHASLRRSQGRFTEALELLDSARAMAPLDAHGRILLNQGSVFMEMEDVERAFQSFEVAEKRIEALGDRRLLMGSRFNQARCLCDLERYAEAEQRLPRVRELAEELRNELDLHRVRWLDGRILAGFGRTGEAHEAFEQVRRALTARGIAYDCALVTLELALLLLDQGRTAEVRSLALKMVWIFRSERVHQKALAALRVFCEAAKQETATLDLTRRVLRFLERARHNPDLQFEE
ncbi:MAG TPA: helix-turn-helix transcriptional regulator [Thermoanaerobaculia bacterium]